MKSARDISICARAQGITLVRQHGRFPLHDVDSWQELSKSTPRIKHNLTKILEVDAHGSKSIGRVELMTCTVD